MFRRVLKQFRLSDGERALVLAYLGVGIAGAFLSFIIVNEIGGGEDIVRSFGLLDLWMMVSGVIGSCLALSFSFKDLGHGGWWGAKHLMRAIVAVTVTGAVIGGTLALPLYGTMFGPLLVVMTLAAHRLLAVFWIATIIAAHFGHLIWRRERDSLFAVPEDDGIPA